MSSKVSQWAKYDEKIIEVLKDPNNDDLGYSDISKEVLGKSHTYQDVDLLRTYIRRNFGHLRSTKPKSKRPKILVYDLETSLCRAEVLTFWPREMYVSGHDLIDQPRIISVAWAWLEDDKVKDLVWDDGDDRELVEKFAEVYNSADLVIGMNNNSFDNRFFCARAAYHNVPLNNVVKSFDVQRKIKSKMRLPSYSLKYLCNYFGVAQKLEHEGRIMWEKVQWGTPEEKKKYLRKMRTYGKGDIVSTLDLFYRVNKYLPAPIHIGALQGEPKWTSPYTGTKNVELYKTTVTSAGTIQRIMKCSDTDGTYKISNGVYLQYLKSLEDKEDA